MRLAVPPLPGDALEAAARFYAEVPPAVAAALADGAGAVTIEFEAADHTHRDWRRAAVRQMARRHAPARVNAIAGGGPAAREAAARYLAAAEGVTGQVLALDDAGAGLVVDLPA